MAMVCNVLLGAAAVPPGVNVGVAMYDRDATRWTHAVNPMMGSPASITPTAPGSTQSGRPMTTVAAHAVNPTSAAPTAQTANAFPRGMRPASTDGALGVVPLLVTESST